MNVSSIGIQLVQTGTATQQRSANSGAGGEGNSDRVTPSAPAQSSLPAGVGETVDKTA